MSRQARRQAARQARRGRGDPRELMTEATRHHQAGRLDQAGKLYRKVLAALPDQPDALHLYGVLCHQSERHDEAVALITRALAAKPGEIPFRYNLGEALRGAGRFAEAATAYREVLEQSPGVVDAWFNLGNAEFEQEHLTAAIEAYREAAGRSPDDPEIHNNLGNALLRNGNRNEASEAFQEAIRARPDYADAWVNLGSMLLRASRWVEAEIHLRRAAELLPDSAPAWENLGSALVELERLDEALDCFRRAAALDPLAPGPLNDIARCLRQQGRFDEAADWHRKALAVDPDMTPALYSLALSRNISSDEEAVLRRLEDRQAELDETRRASLHYALAEIHNTRGEYDEAFAHYRQANDVRDPSSDFDPGKWVEYTDRIIAAHPEGFFADRQDFGTASELPVFVLGMPRSGTTLVEQILASHPAVHGAGELHEIRHLVADMPKRIGSTRSWPDCLPELEAGSAREMAGEHIARLASLAPEADRIVDKMPGNFIRLGLIALLFPNARIIHCRRNPVDICLSCYFQNFDGLEFSTSLANTGFFYQQYERLMAHWRRVVPSAMMDVEYEALVADQETVSRRLIDFLGLEWDDACLAFHESDRSIRTASLWQARQPVYTTSAGRWRRYRSHLGPLLEALGPFAPEAGKNGRE